MLKLRDLDIVESKDRLLAIPRGKILINTINAHSYNMAQKDELFAEALLKGDYLIPDGASIVKACHWLKTASQPKERIAGWDLFELEMARLNQPDMSGQSSNRASKPKCMFLGSSPTVLQKIRDKAAMVYPNIEVVTYSPPYKEEFSPEDTLSMITAINNEAPDLLWIGMTAPKQERWTYQHWDKLKINCHVGTVGAVFDFFAGTMQRAPLWWQAHSLEWLYRLCVEPRRMWRRYVIGNPLFVWNIIRERWA